MKTNEENIKPTFSRPVNSQSKGFEKNFNKTMSQTAPDVILNEVDSLLSETEMSLKKKIFSLPKMEALVFSDPKLMSVYDTMSVSGKERYGYHFNETIMNLIFNDYVLNSAKYLQKYKMAIPKKKKRRDKSGINQLRKAGEKAMHQQDKPKAAPQPVKDVEETTGAGSSGAFSPALGMQKRSVEETTTSAPSGQYSGPAAWGSGDLMKAGKSNPILRKPMWQGGKVIQESNYLVDAKGFEKYIKLLEADLSYQTELGEIETPMDDTIIDKTNAFTSNTVKGWNAPDTKIEYDTLKTGNPDKPNFNSMEEGIDLNIPRQEKINFIVDFFGEQGNSKLPYLNKLDDENLNNIYTKINFKMKKQPVTEVAKSKAQQRLFGMANAVQKGELSPSKVSGTVKKIAKNVNVKDVKDFASTKHEDLPEKVEETDHSIVADNPATMANKPTPVGAVSTGSVPTGMREIKEGMDIFEEINNELDAYSIHHNKLKKMSEDRKPSALVLKDRLGKDNAKNFKSDLGQSGTKEIINIEKELMWKDQQTNVPNDPQKLANDIEKLEVKTGDMKSGEGLKNVGDSANDKGDEIPKRNLTSKEQDEVNLYRKGMHSWNFDNEPGKRFEDRMEADMGKDIYEIRQVQMKDLGKMPMYNKDSQAVFTGEKKTQFDKNKSGWNDPEGLKESMITGRYLDVLNKKRLIDFTLDEVKLVEKINEGLAELDFTGFGNNYNSKTTDYKVSVNETAVKLLSEHKFYTDGVKIFAIKNPVQKLNENEQKSVKPIINEQAEKMKHLLGYKPSSFVKTDNTKMNRGF